MCYKFLYEEPKFDNDIKNYTVDFVFNLDRNGDYCYKLKSSCQHITIKK